MTNRFSGKVAIVTGSSNGIGRATAILFAKEGAKVTITGRNAQRLEETKQEILKTRIPEDHVLAIVTDLATEEGQDELINETIKKFGKLDILVNNAGAAFMDDKRTSGVDQNISKAKKYLVETKGEIVNVSSIGAGPQAQPKFIHYALSKASLDQYTRSAAIDLIQYGVRVNAVSPGVVATGFGEAMGMTREMDQKYFNFLESHKDCIPCGSIGKPIDIANIIAFLADHFSSSQNPFQTMPRFSGNTVIITGSSNGIGRSAALLFAQDGANVTITGRNTERLEETRQLILKSGVSESHLNSVVADVTTSDGQDLLVKSTLDKFGKIHILVSPINLRNHC
ncbi:hypothetical protein L3Y34_007056 [Caenorhabditis briggsae]|uniref:Uncharacterized protein n=1 Tax=Caenorhabditis briggsae TaxID=6238 RepID=A0AAE9CYG6_CAEBR|nr:hypothetical protein L3Y34_007056 [Caenorhabditis briggsae]